MEDNRCGIVRGISPPHCSSRAIGLSALGLLVGGMLALAIDLPLARWFLDDRLPASFDKLARLGEAFGHGLGVATILCVVLVLDPLQRPRWARLLTASLGSGLFANGFKLLVARTRPHDFDFSRGVRGTFVDWLPLWHAPSIEQSFPSSHTATAAGLAVALVWLYPRGKWLFPALAALAASQRMITGAHFLSDTLLGAAVGCWFAHACLPGGLLSKVFDAIEGRTPIADERIAEESPSDSRAA